MATYIIERSIGGTTQYLCDNGNLSFAWKTKRILAWVTSDKDRAEKIACQYNYARVEQIK